MEEKPPEQEQQSTQSPAPTQFPNPPDNLGALAETGARTPGLSRRQERRLLAQVAANGDVQVDERTFIRARTRIGLDKKKWSIATVKAKDQFGKYLGRKITARIQLVNQIDSFDQVQEVFRVAKEMSQNENLPAEVRVKALALITEAAKVGANLSAQIMELAKEAETKDETGNRPRPSNMPPVAAMETTFGEGSQKVTVRVAATNGQPSALPPI